MPEWITDLATQAPMLALALGFIYLMNKYLSAAEARHAVERKDLHDSFLNEMVGVSDRCHEAQDRAIDTQAGTNIAIEKMATSSNAAVVGIGQLNTQIETIIKMVRSNGR